jgi:hypothetical protein
MSYCNERVIPETRDFSQIFERLTATYPQGLGMLEIDPQVDLGSTRYLARCTVDVSQLAGNALISL